ncbi:MAG TPA: hypothetical protein VHW69_01920 [Rhizomicrobium sp.]|jgi:hypothetical protein|nr:hypothetical protein [Rhizomicrobium sp.]
MRLAKLAGAFGLTGSMLVCGAQAKGPACAKPEEVSAIQTAAIQQELMVAALTCNEISRFNAFQTGFAPELRRSDATLARMFKRLYGPRGGEAAYHTFKTKLANDASMRSIHDNPSYCQEAGSWLAGALVSAKPALFTFVNSVQVTITTRPAEACSGGSEAAQTITIHRKRHRAG